MYGEVGGLNRHAFIDIPTVCAVVAASWRADRILSDAEVDCSRRESLANCDWWRSAVDAVEEPARRFAEQGDRGDKVGRLGRHGTCDARRRGVAIWNLAFGDVADHGRALRISAEHHVGVRTFGCGVANLLPASTTPSAAVTKSSEAG
jgi:hypothetical protein